MRSALPTPWAMPTPRRCAGCSAWWRAQGCPRHSSRPQRRLPDPFPSTEEAFMTGLTRQCAEFVASLDSAAIPQRAYDAARIGMTDCIATMIAGAQEPAVDIVRGIVAESTAADAAPEVPSGRNLLPGDAALVNGVAGHVLDYDDVAIDGHPSAAMTPAIFAEGW